MLFLPDIGQLFTHVHPHMLPRSPRPQDIREGGYILALHEGESATEFEIERESSIFCAIHLTRTCSSGIIVPNEGKAFPNQSDRAW
jgi:hypothetical protein